MNCDECKSRLRKDNETGGNWCPVCSFNNARARQLQAERERDEARAELERVKAERDAALVKIKVLFNVAHDAVGHVSAANYPERESLAHKRIDDCYDGKP